jgi:hypothetical protein
MLKLFAVPLNYTTRSFHETWLLEYIPMPAFRSSYLLKVVVAPAAIVRPVPPMVQPVMRDDVVASELLENGHDVNSLR